MVETAEIKIFLCRLELKFHVYDTLRHTISNQVSGYKDTQAGLADFFLWKQIQITTHLIFLQSSV